MARASFKVKPRGRFSDSPALARKTGGVSDVPSAAAATTKLISSHSPACRNDQFSTPPAAQHQRFDMKLLFQLGKRQLIIQLFLPGKNIGNSLLAKKGFISVASAFDLP